jgi:cysteine desulfurase family protein (TIGR01976 family)
MLVTPKNGTAWLMLFGLLNRAGYRSIGRMVSCLNMTDYRQYFPSLAEGRPGAKTVFFDGAAGTQICARSLERMNEAKLDENANFGGAFETSQRAGELVRKTREAAARFFNAWHAREIVFGQNMTTLTLAMARTFGRRLKAGDEIVLTRMDHDANVAPWLSLAEDLGLTVKWLDFSTETYDYELGQLDDLLTARTKLVAVNYASNVIGTINDVRAITARAQEAGALVFVDAVQYAPHGVIDVRAIGCDFLVCSAYKFYGPHAGILWGKLDLLEELDPYKVRTAPAHPPDKFETGTKSREGIAGVLGAIEHLQMLGMAAIVEYEAGLTRRLIDGLRGMKGLRIHGKGYEGRVPTLALTVEGKSPAEVAKVMAGHGINVWNGHNYGWEPVRRLGLLESGGIVRVSLARYNTAAEVDLFLERLGELALGSCS